MGGIRKRLALASALVLVVFFCFWGAFNPAPARASFNFTHPGSSLMLGHTESDVIKYGSTYYMYYRTSSDNIAVASSADGSNWTEQGTALTQTALGSNLLANPSFESGSGGPTSWNASANTAWSSAQARTGSQSVEINTTATSADWRADHYAVSASQDYLASGWIKGTVSADQFFLTVRWFSDAGGTVFISEQNIAIPVGTYSSWQYFSANVTAPSNALSSDFEFRSVNGTGDAFADDVGLQANSWDSNYVIHPSVAFYDGTFYMFYEGNNTDHSQVGYATATDPTGPFTKSGSNPILSPQGAGFESVTVGTPAIVRDNNKWYLWYHGYDGTHDQTGVAWSTNLTSWTRHPSNPVLPSGTSGSWDDFETAPGSVLLYGGTQYIFYEGNQSNLKWHIGEASISSSSIETSTPTKSAQNPILSASPGSWDDDYVQLPYIVNPGNGQLWLYYSGHNTSANAFYLGLAVDSTNGLVPNTPSPNPGQRSLVLGSSKASAVTTYTFNFTPKNTGNIGAIKFEVCDSPTESATCINSGPSSGASFTSNSASVASQSGISGFAVGTGIPPPPIGNTFWITNGTPQNVSSSMAVSVELQNVRNPAANNEFYARITLYSDSSGTQEVEYGAVAVSTANQVTVSANVLESLTFCVYTSASCAGGGASIDLGTLSPTFANGGISHMDASTNGGSGYEITYTAGDLSSPNDTITAAGGSASTFSAGSPMFGINLAANTSPAVGAGVSGAGTGSVIAPYTTANSVAFISDSAPHTVANASGPTASNTYTVSYLAQAGNTSKAGNYTTSFVWIATATY